MYVYTHTYIEYYIYKYKLDVCVHVYIYIYVEAKRFHVKSSGFRRIEFMAAGLGCGFKLSASVGFGCKGSLRQGPMCTLTGLVF